MIAIHNSPEGFHPRWIAYCKKKGIEFKLVDCYSSDLIEQLQGSKCLFWHHSQNNPKALIAAKPILFALEHAGIKVFPDFKTNWHFDDKIGQKYLLEAFNIPHAKTWVFYDKDQALQWTKTTTFPKVFKLRRGAGSANVRLVKTAAQARHVIRKAFKSGFSPYNRWGNLSDDIRLWQMGKANFNRVLNGFYHLLFAPNFASVAGKEKGCVLFQEFIPGNTFDIRVVVVANKAFAIKRLVRDNDFRASGSGTILYEKELFNDSWIALAFDINRKIQAQVLALDYVFLDGKPLVVEISYGFAPGGYDPCTGYWDKNLQWHEGPFDPYGWMIELMLNENARNFDY